MAYVRADHHPFAAADTPSFRDLLDRVTADDRLDPRRKADLRSAIRRSGSGAAAISPRDAGASPLSAGAARPAAAGVSRKRLQNARSAIAFGLDRYGLGGRRSYLTPPSPAARALYDRLRTSKRPGTNVPGRGLSVVAGAGFERCFPLVSARELERSMSAGFC